MALTLFAADPTLSPPAVGLASAAGLPSPGVLADAAAGVLADAAAGVLADVSGGGYVSVYKSVILLGLLFLWCRLIAWSDKDAPLAHLPRHPLNIANISGMVLAYALVFMLPMSFWVVLPIVLLIFGAEVAVYLHMRNKVAGLKDLKRQWQEFKKGLTMKKKADAPGAVELLGKEGPLPIPAGASADRAAYDAVQVALTDPLRKGADQIDLTPVGGDGGVAVKYLVDCVSYTLPTPLDAAGGPAAIAYIKTAAGLDVAERRKPQKGKLKLTIDKEKRETEVQSAGTTAGEYLRVMVSPTRRHALKLPEIGLSDAQLAALREATTAGGLVLLATPKGQGLTQLAYGMMRGHDAFLQHLQGIERDPPETVEGVTPNPLAASASPEEEAKKVDWVISQHPDVLLLDKIESPQSAAHLINFALGDEDTPPRRAYVGMRAGSSAEALEQWRRVAGGDRRAIDAVRMVVCGRVVRKLCDACKESYTPDPQTLRKLNMNPEKVTELYKARETPLRDPKGNPVACGFCKDLRFKGRRGVFEVLQVTDDLREAIAADLGGPGGKLGSNFKAAFRKARGRYLQEEALALVERGETSVQEVLRVLKPAEEPAAPSAGRTVPTASAARGAARAPAAARPAGGAAPPPARRRA